MTGIPNFLSHLKTWQRASLRRSLKCGSTASLIFVLLNLLLLFLKSILIKQRSRSPWVNQRISAATTRRHPQTSIGTIRFGKLDSDIWLIQAANLNEFRATPLTTNTSDSASSGKCTAEFELSWILFARYSLVRLTPGR